MLHYIDKGKHCRSYCRSRSLPGIHLIAGKEPGHSPVENLEPEMKKKLNPSVEAVSNSTDSKGSAQVKSGVALRESEELFHSLCDSAPIGIFRADSEGNNIYCSPGWEIITGMSASEGMGKGWIKGILQIGRASCRERVCLGV